MSVANLASLQRVSRERRGTNKSDSGQRTRRDHVMTNSFFESMESRRMFSTAVAGQPMSQTAPNTSGIDITMPAVCHMPIRGETTHIPVGENFVDPQPMVD